MIQKIRLKNFQSHKDSEIEFSKGVNTVLGTSSHGKSSIMRGFTLVSENRPDGIEFVSNWCDKKKDNSEISITLEEDTITRIKGKDNEYIINDLKLSGFGRGSAPEEVDKILNLGGVNIQKQEDSFFLFNMSSGEVLRRINSYVDLELIDHVLFNADADKRKNVSELKTTNSLFAKYKDQLSAYDILPSIEVKYDKCNSLKEIIDSKEKDNEEIRDFITLLIKLKVKLDPYKNIERLCNRIERSSKSFKDIKVIQKELDVLQSTISSLKDKTKILKKVSVSDTTVLSLEQSIELLKDVNKEIETTDTIKGIVDGIKSKEESLGNFPSKHSEIEACIKTLHVITDKEEVNNQIEEICSSCSNKSERVKSLQEKIETLDEEYHTSMPEVCPLCNTRLKEEK